MGIKDTGHGLQGSHALKQSSRDGTIHSPFRMHPLSSCYPHRLLTISFPRISRILVTKARDTLLYVHGYSCCITICSETLCCARGLTATRPHAQIAIAETEV